MLPYLWMIAGAFAFAVMSECAHALGKYCDWQLVAIVRAGLAMLMAMGLAWSSGSRLVVWGSSTLWMRSIAGSVSLVCGFYALTRLPVSDVMTLTNMFPLWVGLLSWPLLGESPPVWVWPAAACGLAGVWLLQQPQLAAGNVATWAALAASITSAVALIGLHRVQGIDARAIVAHFSGVSLLFSAVSLLVFQHSPRPWGTLDSAGVGLMAVLGVAATIGQLLLTKAFSAEHPAKMSVVALCQVAFVMVLDVLLWQRSFSVESLCGIGLIMLPTAGVLLARGA